MKKYPNHPLRNCPNCGGEFVRVQNYDQCLCLKCKSKAGWGYKGFWFERQIDNTKIIYWFIDDNKCTIYAYNSKTLIELDFYLPYDITEEQIELYLKFV